MEVEAAESTETQVEETYESPSIASMLPGAKPAVEEPAEAAMVETPEPAAPVTSEAPSAPPVAPTDSAQPAPSQQDLIQAEVAKATKGILNALQQERQKRQALEAQSDGLVPEDQAQRQIQQMRGQLIAQEERWMRQTHSDYDEVYALFATEAATNQALAETVLASDSPAQAAYQVGLNIRLAKEFGPDTFANPHALVGKVREKVLKDERAKIEAEIRKEYDEKLSVKAASRALTPTDITQARAAGGAPQPYQSPNLGDLLSAATRRRP